MWVITPTKFIAKVFILTEDSLSMEISKDEFLKLLGENTKKLRLSRDLSLRDLATRCDIDYSDISKIEKGLRNIQLSTILELSKGLEIHPKELFDFKLGKNSCI